MSDGNGLVYLLDQLGMQVARMTAEASVAAEREEGLRKAVTELTAKLAAAAASPNEALVAEVERLTAENKRLTAVATPPPAKRPPAKRAAPRRPR